MSVKSRNISYLLSKYETKQPGENLKSKKLKKELNNQRWRTSQKIRMSDYIMDRLNLRGVQRQRVKYLVSRIDFNELCRNCSNETIITAISYYIKKEGNSKIKLSDYKICSDYNLNETVLSTIMINLCSQIQKNTLWTN